MMDQDRIIEHMQAQLDRANADCDCLAEDYGKARERAEEAENRIQRALAIPEPEFSDRPFANENGANEAIRGQRAMREAFRAVLLDLDA